MDQDVTVVVTRPLPVVFARLSDPTRLSTWLTSLGAARAAEYDAGPGGPTPSEPLDASFVVRLGGHDAVGEVIGHEPPRYVAYRVTTSRSAHVLRVTCAAGGAGTTRVRVHQSGAEQLAIDLPALDRLLHEDVAAS